jgi:hypothetical protein
MTPGQLVKAVAIAMDVPEETVVQHDRNLAVAGLRTTGARGRNAPDVTPLDAARLFIAVLASVRTKDSVDTVRAFGKTKFEPPKSEAELFAGLIDGPLNTDKYFDPAIMALPIDHNAIDAIAALISDASLPITDLQEHLKRFALVINCEPPLIEAKISHLNHVGSSRAAYRKPETASVESNYVETTPHERYARYYGIFQRRDIYGAAIMLLGKAFRDNGLPFKTTDHAMDDLLGLKKAQAKKKAG